MKLLVAVVILFSASVMAANQCKPDDVCLTFKTNKDELPIACKNIESAKISLFSTYFENNKSLAIVLKEDAGLGEFSAKNINQLAELYIRGVKYNQAVFSTRLGNSLQFSVKDAPDFQSIDSLIKCVN
ncbi:hypothetical protein AAZR23_08120 [Morganella sp. Je.2.23]|uniref:hypothetical protein n=1 Tax=Morganella sp. Je.2.23 TaxID=3142840 RepID=UPI003DA7D45C